MAVNVIKEKCKGCTKCIKSCPFEAITMEGKLAVIGTACTGCGQCIEVCPFGAVEKTEEEKEGKDLSVYKGVWVFAEQRDGKLMQVAVELLGEGRKLAAAVGCELCAVLCGNGVENLADELFEYGADKVYYADAPELKQYTTDGYTKVIYEAITSYKPEIVLLGATHIGRDLGPCLAVKCNTGLTADCTKLEIDPETKGIMQTRPAFGGNLMATIICPNHRPQMATVRPGIFKAPEFDYSRSGTITQVVLADDVKARVEISIPAEEWGQQASIADAERLVVVGRGIGSKKNLPLMRKLADALGAELGCTRPIVEAGWLEYRHQIGQTGVSVSPKLLVSIGVSGAIQHLAGIGGAECIIAINEDPDAPIFGAAQYKVVGDAVEVVEELLAQFER